MRRLITLFMAVFVAALVAGCGNSAGTNDPYELMRRASAANQDQLQIDIGASVNSGSTTFSLDPGAVRIVIDGPAGKGTFHLSLPTAALGLTSAQLAQFGITGTTIDMDVLWDGQALYAKSPILGALMPALAAEMDFTLPSGDLTGWLKLLTKADIDSFGGGSIVAPTAEATMPDAATLKQQMDEVGITLTLAGTETKNGVSANHIKGTIDGTKLLASSAMASVSAAQRAQVEAALKDATLSFDLWTDASSNRLVEIDVHVVGAGTSSENVDVTIGFSTPSSPNFDTPSGAVEIPTMKIIGQLIQMFGASLGS